MSKSFLNDRTCFYGSLFSFSGIGSLSVGTFRSISRNLHEAFCLSKTYYTKCVQWLAQSKTVAGTDCIGSLFNSKLIHSVNKLVLKYGEK